MRRRTLASALIAAITLAPGLAACSSSGGGGGGSTGDTSSASGTYNIGYSNGLTGQTAAFATPGSKVVRAVFNAVNASGGIHGHKIKLTVLDQGNPGSGQAAENVTQLATQDNVSAILGMSISDDCASVLTLAAKYTTPLLCERVPSSDLSPVQQYVFNDTSSELAEVQPQVVLLKKLVSKPHPRVAILTSETIGAEAWAAALRQAVKADGGTTVSYQVMPLTATSVSTQEAAIVASHPDVLLGEIYQQFWDPLLGGMKSAGLSIPVITTDGDVFYSDLVSLKLPDLYEASIAAPLDPDPTNAAQKQLIAALTPLLGKTASELNSGEGSSIVAGPYAVVAALQACGYPCPGSKLAPALEKASTTAAGLIPGGFTYTPAMHFGVRQLMFYHWDSSAGRLANAATEPAGNPVTAAAH